MRTALYGLLLALWLLAWPFPFAHASTPIGAVMGGAVECDPNNPGCIPFPTSASILCMGSGANLDCPQWFHPDWSQSPGSRFYGITNRTNPPRYLTSTDGIAWTLTTTQPFVAAVLNFGSYMAVSSDGSLLAVSGQGANTCIIRRSTDQGANWSTVFTSAVRNCSVGFGNPTPPGVYCTETGGYCAFNDMFDVANIRMIFSTDNGANWTIGTAYAYVSADSQVWGPIVSADGSGINTRGVNSTGGAGQPFGTKGASDFSATLPFIPAVNLNCRPFVMGNNKRAFCRPNAGGVISRIFSGGATGIAPVELSTFVTADVPTVGGSQDFQPGGFNSTYGYAITSNLAGTRYNIYITGDGALSFVLTQVVIPTIVPIVGCCRGNLMRWGNKMYWTTAGTSSQAIFGVIQ